MATASIGTRSGSAPRARPFRNVSVMGVLVALGLIAYYAVVFIYPFYRAVWLSFHNWDFIVDPIPVGTRNYQRAFEDEYFWKALKVTVMFSVAEIAAGIFASFLVALGVSQLRGGRLQRAFLGIFYLPVIIPSIVTVLLWRFLYLPSGGAFNSMLGKLGIPPQPFLNSPDQALWCIVLMVVWANVGGSAIIFFAGINEVSTDLLEASRLDGAGLWRQTIDIIVPIMKPIFFYQIVVSVIGTVQMFEQFYLLTGPAFSTRTLAVYTYDLGFKTLSLGYGAAVSILIFLLLLIATAVQFRGFLMARGD
ncbi:MAG: sugar ABC transporter permease [Thermomicrobiales bacterium]